MSAQTIERFGDAFEAMAQVLAQPFVDFDGDDAARLLHELRR